MTVNIQFCGGCNPHYDRGIFARKIRQAYPEIDFVCNAKENTDAVLILCGCSTACVIVPKKFGPAGRMTVTGGDCWDKVAAFMDRLSKEMRLNRLLADES